MTNYDFAQLTPEERELWEQQWRRSVSEEMAKRMDKIIYDTLMRQEQPKSDGRVDV